MERWTNQALLSLFQFRKEAVGPFNRATWPDGAAVPNGFDETHVADKVYRRMIETGVFSSFETPPTSESLLKQVRAVTRHGHEHSS